MWSPPQKPVGVVKQQQRQQQSEQPRRTPSLEKSRLPHFFKGWNEGALSQSSEPGLQPPVPPSPQPSPKTQLSTNPFEIARSLRLGERPQRNLKLPTNAHADEDFFALPITDHENIHDLVRTPTIELHPAQHKPTPTAPAPAPTSFAPTPTSSSSEKGSHSDASSFAYVLSRERVTKRNFKRVMRSPPHLSHSVPSRPAPPKSIVSSPAIVMQSAPPSPGFQPVAKSSTFSEALSTSRTASSNRHDAAHGHISFQNSKLKTRRAKASVAPGRSIGHSTHKAKHDSPSRGFNQTSVSHELKPPGITQKRSSDSIPTRELRRRSDHPGRPVSFVSAVDSVEEPAKKKPEQTDPPLPTEEVPKQGFRRVLTVHSIVPAPVKRRTTKLQQNESPDRRRSRQLSTMSRSPSPTPRCFGLFNSHSRRRRGTNTSIQTESTITSSSPKRKDSYFGGDGREYMHSPIAGLSFLPSEMQRVNTPPVRTPMSPGSRSRGFFFDYTNPPDAGDEAETRRDSVAGSTDVDMRMLAAPWDFKRNVGLPVKDSNGTSDYF
ncbi:hypothetical protein E4T47_06242 [Aureobasidium subglaciale]|nr:hypothetical protein E4T47_06242 [Aureobasidium subglaciale]